MKGWNNLNLEPPSRFEPGALQWKSSTLTTKIIGKTYNKCTCLVFANIKQTLQVSNRYLLIMHSSPFFRWIKFCSGCFRQFFFFFIWGPKKVVAGRSRQVVVLYSNNCMEIGLGKLSIGCFRQAVVLWRSSYKQVWQYSQDLCFIF